MFTCKIENSRNNILELTQNESSFQVISILGLNPPNAQINRSVVAGVDGAKFNSSKLEERDIVLTIKINGDVERNRLALYQFFITKEWCKFYYKNGSRDVYIEGYIETNEVDLFSNNEIMQVSILCPNPYFKAMEMIVDDISKSLAAFEFPFSINLNSPIEFSRLNTSKVTTVINESESETGLIINIDFLKIASKIQIVNVSTGKTFIINNPFLKNDKVVINTNKGEKSVKLIRNGVETNLFGKIDKSSEFFQLFIGNNLFSYLVDNGSNDDAAHIEFTHYTMYRGV